MLFCKPSARYCTPISPIQLFVSSSELILYIKITILFKIKEIKRVIFYSVISQYIT